MQTFKEEVNAAFLKAAQGPMKGILSVSDEPLVSCDYRGNVNSSIVDGALTAVLGDDLVKVVAWYVSLPLFARRRARSAQQPARDRGDSTRELTSRMARRSSRESARRRALALQDNEYGYSMRVVDLAMHMASKF